MRYRTHQTLPLWLTAVSVLAGCRAHDPYSLTATLANDGQCEDALAALTPAKSPGNVDPFTAPPRPAAGGGAAYPLTAAGGNMSDVLISISGGIAFGVIVCSPLGPPDARVKVSADCVAEADANADPGPSPGVLQTPVDWRDDTDFTPLSRALRRIAECYEGRGGRPSLVTAFVQLQQIVEGPVYDHAADSERQRVDAQLDRVEGKLKLTAADYVKDIFAKDDEISAAKAAVVKLK